MDYIHTTCYTIKKNKCNKALPRRGNEERAFKVLEVSLPQRPGKTMQQQVARERDNMIFVKMQVDCTSCAYHMHAVKVTSSEKLDPKKG